MSVISYKTLQAFWKAHCIRVLLPTIRYRHVIGKLVPLALLLPLATALLGPGRTMAADQGLSLRILTYNTAFLWIDLPGICGSIDLNAGTIGGVNYERRAQEIAKAILQTDNDVVVLNEVFSDDVKQTLVSMLGKDYQNYISKVYTQREIEINNALLTVVLGPVSLPCQDFLGLSPTTTFSAADSGLMIFLKKGLQFVPFSFQTPPPYDVTIVTGQNNGKPWGGPGQIAVLTYDFDPSLGVLDTGDCYGDDCLATKAAVMVSVESTSSKQISNIVFSHLQAWNGAGQVKAREAQFEAIRALITKSLTPAQLTGQPLYLVGDLNVPGQNKASASAKSEWTHIFNSSASSSGNFFACGLGPCTFTSTTGTGSYLTDGWGFETSVADKGITNADDKARLDYVLHNHNLPTPFSDRKFCLQHVMRAYDLVAGVSPLSDHIGVRADINQRAAHCSANEQAGVFGPQPLILDNKGNVSVAGTIQFPGSMRWLKFEKGQGWGTGSYVFSIAPTAANFDIDFDVYQAKNLSKPIPVFSTDPAGRWVKYSLPEPPYYIRVFAINPSTGKPDRTLTGTYHFTMHENRGITPGDAIALSPAVETPYPWPGIPLNAQSTTKDNVIFAPNTEVWFEFYTDTSTAGVFPRVDFLVENSLGIDTGLANPPFSLKLRADSSGQPVLAQAMSQAPGGVVYIIQSKASETLYHDYDMDQKPDYRLVAPDLPGTGSGPKRYFLTVRRHTPAQIDDVISFITFRTSLTYINSLRFSILEEVTWGPAADHAWFQWAYDGSGTHACVTISGAYCYGPKELDDGYTWDPQHSAFHGSFAEFLTPKVWEDSVELKPHHFSRIESLFLDEPAPVHHAFVWRKGAYNADDADYWYELRYCVGHVKALVAQCQLTD